ncbi:uncharacterized protein LOC114532236 [Dendronephthya gigantea]|uniref:uncharacterized protein LOC114532236 n=1 Tax=Dendronephthya gigantea TaxID=151771 RepID=UPI00106BD61A|nr:uncharacterized protein LOC114532236 [Dendronephthya gigantea]XP_028409568.1 uncharacterized protein LOC114532236 [Dendronephthya gigantea]XP_028409569.1 uncharacterized protein LOC114532236 [Dendronephthya gigantea]XP_028409570.1 uncharacterized protein LOC114532236 [Dendronephthya gigantea]XP_028409571.1 uncharacterized protein LOC114532236 [Dendronephthya gigantea]XP_028409572.1 uncharacterized protein LOC114532236 [Dendronephthya gigantea]
MSLTITAYTVLLLATLHIPQVSCVFLFIAKKTKANMSESIVIPMSNLMRPPNLKSAPGVMGLDFSSYRKIAAINSTDERCESGQPLSSAILDFAPYAYMSFSGRPVFPPRSVIKNGTKKMIYVEPIIIFYGFFPEILKKAIPTCCHAKSNIQFGKLQTEQYVPDKVKPPDVDHDFSFPLYGESMDDTTYKSNGFIPIIQAPSVALVVPSNFKEARPTYFLATTIFKVWPLFLFVVLLAGSAGIVMWCLDRAVNAEQFPKPFLQGALEGFWWAFITMTTVGYGDRTPKSLFGRFFGIFWIIFGVVIISILSGIIITIFNASTKVHFNIHGAKIGAVTGSKEYMFGLSLNADMRDFRSNIGVFAALTKDEVDGIFIDNYVANLFGKTLAEYNYRVDRMMDHPITYGIRLGRGSERLQKCIRKYLKDHPQEVFDMFSKSFEVNRNPKDHENLRQKEAEKLYHKDKLSDDLRKYGAIFVFSILFIGLFLQFAKEVYLKIKNRSTTSTFLVTERHWGGSFEEINSPVKDLLHQYNCFQDGWMKKMKSVHQE